MNRRGKRMKSKISLACAAVFCAAVLMTGCVNPVYPANTNAGMNGLQQRALLSRNIGYDLDATYDDVWYAAVSTLQMNGFILRQADRASGYIYGVWQNTYEPEKEVSRGGFAMISTVQMDTPVTFTFGEFFSITYKFKQVEVAATLQPLARTQTLVRLTARFDNEGIPMAEGHFASRFFGLLRKEIFLRKNRASVYTVFQEKQKKDKKEKKELKPNTHSITNRKERGSL